MTTTRTQRPSDATDLFDVCGPLPTGTTVLEASAGTGKTFTIAALAARYVAAGTPLEQLLLVTFTRMATGELRERVRDRLVTAERGLSRALAGVTPAAGPELPAAGKLDDDVLRLLATGSNDVLEQRRRRLADAIADFDAATIATTHQFCQHILGGLGVAGDVEQNIVFIEDAGDLVDEVVDDLYVRKFFGRNEAPAFGRDEALRIGRLTVNNPQSEIEPKAALAGSTAELRQRLAVAVRNEVEVRKRQRKLITYDDLLTRLAATLSDPVRGPAACARLRERYRVALVDEFQDTDQVQWQILHRAFGDGGGQRDGDGDGAADGRHPTTLVLIGDPKQAVYAFRGADVHAYLKAAATAGTRATLGVNWRSDQGLIDAYDAVLRGTRLGHPDIRYRTVRAADANREPGLVGAPSDVPLRIRVVHRDDHLVSLTPKGHVQKGSAQTHIAQDLAADVVRLLSSKAELIARDTDGAETGRDGVRPGDVAVLVRTNKQADMIRDALVAVGIPAVINGAGSVFETPMARQWLILLEALERPSSPARAHAVALTPFLGWTAEQVATADEDAWESLFARLHRWAAVLRRNGVASLIETVTRTERLPGRILQGAAGERELTDVRHIGHLLHLEAVSEQLGVTALAGWLRHRIAEYRKDAGNEERSRRLDSDADAVQVLTIHRSKGLEFPIVYFPNLWDSVHVPKDELPVFHDPETDTRTIDVGLVGADFVRHQHRALTEQRGEDLRLAYVALTRARHQAVVWWASTWESRNSPLGRLLFARDGDGNVASEADDAAGVPHEDEVGATFRNSAAEVPGRIAVERSTGGDGARWTGPPVAPVDLSVSRFDRSFDATWRRTSYSSITAGAHDAHVASEADDTGTTDEELVDGSELPLAAPASLLDGAGRADRAAETDASRATDEAALRAVPSLLATMPGGTSVGTLIHGVLETVDFAAGDLNTELANRLGDQHATMKVEVGDPAVVLAGLRAAIETPLGPLIGQRSLHHFGRADRLDELAFELPLAGGDEPRAAVTIDAIAELLRDRLPADDPLTGYADRLETPALQQQLRGFLNGSIDLVLRIHDDDGPQRFAVVDYKTNWLGLDGDDLSAWHYRPAAMADAMQRAHYPLQALLYSVALHRYLRWRLPDYDPDRNLAGIAYLFLRGMTGASTPEVDGQRCGVFAWQPPVGLIDDLSDLLDGSRT